MVTFDNMTVWLKMLKGFSYGKLYYMLFLLKSLYGMIKFIIDKAFDQNSTSRYLFFDKCIRKSGSKKRIISGSLLVE